VLLPNSSCSEIQYITAAPRHLPKRIVISRKLAKLRNGRATQFVRTLIAEMFERHPEGVLVSLEPRQKQHQNLGWTCTGCCGVTRVNLIAEMRNSAVGVASHQRLEINVVITVEILERRVAMVVKFRR